MAEIVDFGLQQHKIKMDSRYFENVLSVVAGDTGRRIEVQLLDTNGLAQDTTGLNLRLNAEIAGKATFTDATLVDAATGKYQLDLSNGMFLAPGNWQFQWQITDSAGKKLHSFAFTGTVGVNLSEGGSQATNFYLNIEELKSLSNELKTQFGDIIDDTVINLYDPSLAVDKKLNSYSNGTYADFPTGAVLGKQPVSPGKTYTISMPESEKGFDKTFRCFNSNVEFIGNSMAISTNPIAQGVSSGEQFVADGRKQVTLSIEEDSPVRFVETSILWPYATHTDSDFDRIRKNIQFEIGYSFSKFEVYGSASYKILDSAMPESYSSLRNDVDIINQIINGDTVLIKQGNLVYIRTGWSEEKDLLQKMELVENGGYLRNNIFQFTGYGLIPKETPLENTTSALYTAIKVATDDTAPLQYNGTYIGASHGAFAAVNLLSTGHGKTTNDVGSTWTDSSGRKYHIIRIVDANNIWVLSENIATNGTWSFDTIVERSLTHTAGATHTTTISYTTQTVNQIVPSVKNIKQRILNQRVDVIDDGIYKGDTFEIVESYEITNPTDLLEKLIAHVGSSTPLAFDNNLVKSEVKNINTYSFQSNGACVVYNSVEFLNLVKNNYFGMVQSNALPIPAGGKIKEYVPKSLPVIAGGVTYNLKNAADVSALGASIDVTKTEWEFADNPPDRSLQFTEESNGSKLHGFILGYCPEIGIGKKDVRKTLVNSAFSMPVSKKQYPRAVSKGNTVHASDYIQPGTFFEGIAYRIPVNYTLYPKATNVSWYKVSEVLYLMIDYHMNVDDVIKLPESFLNKRIEIVEKTPSFNLMSSFVTLDGIRVRVTDGYGYAVLRLI